MRKISRREKQNAKEKGGERGRERRAEALSTHGSISTTTEHTAAGGFG